MDKGIREPKKAKEREREGKGEQGTDSEVTQRGKNEAG